MEYGEDPEFFTQGLLDQEKAAMMACLTNRTDWSDFGRHLAFATGLWESEADARLNGDESEITQFEFWALSSGLPAYGDYLGVYTPNIWEVFVSTTANPGAPAPEQSRLPRPEGDDWFLSVYRLVCLAEGENMRLALATPQGEAPATPTASRYKPPACPKCEDGDTHVASVRKRFRWLCCKSCGHRWKVTK